MNFAFRSNQIDKGAYPRVMNVEQMGVRNPNFRTTIWTGIHMQMTLMSIPPDQDIGLEVHPETDQLIRVEQGTAVVKMGESEHQQNFERIICEGEVVFVPAGTWHNVINMEKNPLKLSVTYAPPNHSQGTVHRTKAEAEREENER